MSTTERENLTSAWITAFIETHQEKVSAHLRDIALCGTHGNWSALRFYPPTSGRPDCLKTDDYGKIVDVYEVSPMYPTSEYFRYDNHPITFCENCSYYAWSPSDGGYQWDIDENGDWLASENPDDWEDYAAIGDEDMIRDQLRKYLSEDVRKVHEKEIETGSAEELLNLALANGFCRFSPGCLTEGSFQDEADEILLRLVTAWTDGR